jgi:hypothetical protein
MRHDPAGASIVIMLRSLKLYGMANAPSHTCKHVLPGNGRRLGRPGCASI